MKKMLMTAAAGMLMAGGLFAQSNFGRNVDAREYRQQDRIGQGVRSGSLTRGETRFIENRENALHNQIRYDRFTGGRLNYSERAQIARQQNRLSREIYTLKHNGCDRY